MWWSLLCTWVSLCFFINTISISCVSAIFKKYLNTWLHTRTQKSRYTTIIIIITGQKCMAAYFFFSIIIQYENLKEKSVETCDCRSEMVILTSPLFLRVLPAFHFFSRCAKFPIIREHEEFIIQVFPKSRAYSVANITWALLSGKDSIISCNSRRGRPPSPPPLKFRHWSATMCRIYLVICPLTLGLQTSFIITMIWWIFKYLLCLLLNWLDEFPSVRTVSTYI